ncbi:hypothetical protein [Methanobacterium subterraneum]|uniref:hypothetical protein n=1 Tax=Methanobacterium subterraneum TaxID=59277 RepID=UPI0012FD1C9A|nr:hypothetical protein [Methanobacterium subterraneum]
MGSKRTTNIDLRKIISITAYKDLLHLREKTSKKLITSQLLTAIQLLSPLMEDPILFLLLGL